MQIVKNTTILFDPFKSKPAFFVHSCPLSVAPRSSITSELAKVQLVYLSKYFKSLFSDTERPFGDTERTFGDTERRFIL